MLKINTEKMSERVKEKNRRSETVWSGKRKIPFLLLTLLLLSLAGTGCGTGSQSKGGGPDDVKDPSGEPSTEVLDEKPVIYIYGEEDGQNVDVTLNTEREITCEYPARPDGESTWYVKADRDGRLQFYPSQMEREKNTQIEGLENEYNYLYWEGKTNAKYDFSEGFCVAGRDTVYFLEEKLAKIGLNRREANEFIVYWLPKMQGNKFNIISFQKEAYTNDFPLVTSPAGDMLRVFMAYKASDKQVDIPEQNLDAIRGDFDRDGLTIVEWGGALVK